MELYIPWNLFHFCFKIFKSKFCQFNSFLHREQASSALFFQYNTQLGPPYYVLVDTNFINFSIKNKLDIVKSMMDCLYAKCKLCFLLHAVGEVSKTGMSTYM